LSSNKKNPKLKTAKLTFYINKHPPKSKVKISSIHLDNKNIYDTQKLNTKPTFT